MAALRRYATWISSWILRLYPSSEIEIRRNGSNLRESVEIRGSQTSQSLRISHRLFHRWRRSHSFRSSWRVRILPRRRTLNLGLLHLTFALLRSLAAWALTEKLPCYFMTKMRREEDRDCRNSILSIRVKSQIRTVRLSGIWIWALIKEKTTRRDRERSYRSARIRASEKKVIRRLLSRIEILGILKR